MGRMRRHSTETVHLLFYLLGGFVLLFLAAPLLSMALESSRSELFQTIEDPEVRRSIWLTVWTSMAATVLSAIFAVPLAYVLARKEFPLKGLVSGLVDLPIVIPHSAAGIAVLGVVSRDTLLGQLAEKIGLRFVSNPAGIMAAMAFVSLPFLVNAARDGFQAVPEKLQKAALNLGASPLRVFFTVSVPLARRSILSGFLLMWARGMSEFGAVIIVAYHPMVMPILIYERFGAFGLAYARPVALIFVALCLFLLVLLRVTGGKEEPALR